MLRRDMGGERPEDPSLVAVGDSFSNDRVALNVGVVLLMAVCWCGGCGCACFGQVFGAGSLSGRICCEIFAMVY